MATTNDIYAEMQRYAPLELAESWDNPGLLVDCGREVSRVLVTLDITPEVVEEAAAGGCELIVSHHPVIFSPLKKLTPRDVSFQLVQKGISAICMHTNLDAAEGGVNEVLAGIFGMRDWEVFADGCGRVGEVEPITVPELARKAQAVLGGRCNRPRSGPAVQVKFADTGRIVKRLAVISGAGGSMFEDALADGCGRVGEVEPITVPELARKAQAVLGGRCNRPRSGPAVQVKFADTGRIVKRLAVISGAGGSMFEDALAVGADCLLTGEANHHAAIDAVRLGLSLVAAGHYATEFPVCAAIADRLRTAFPELEVRVSGENRDPFTYI